MTFTDTGPGQLKVTCNGDCGAQLEQTAENKGTNLLDFMRDAGWAVGSNLCPECVEQKPGVWTGKVEVCGNRAGKITRMRKIRRLL